MNTKFLDEGIKGFDGIPEDIDLVLFDGIHIDFKNHKSSYYRLHDGSLPMYVISDSGRIKIHTTSKFRWDPVREAYRNWFIIVVVLLDERFDEGFNRLEEIRFNTTEEMIAKLKELVPYVDDDQKLAIKIIQQGLVNFSYKVLLKFVGLNEN